MNSIPALFACIEENAPRFQRLLEDFVAAESFTFETEAVSHAVSLLAEFGKSLGFSAHVKAFPNAGDGLVLENASGDLPPVCLRTPSTPPAPSRSF